MTDTLLDAATAHRAADPRFPPLGAFETVEGARLHLVDRGPRDAIAVVLIHGASGNLRDFEFDLSDRLAERYRVLSVDRPGFGYSDRGPRDAHRPDVQARLIRGALAQRGVARAIVLGHSLGAAPALAWALDAPASVIGVVDLAGVALPWPGGVRPLYHLAATRLLGPLLTGAVGAIGRRISPARIDAELARIFHPQPTPAGYAAFIGAQLALRPSTLRANAEDVSHLKPFVRHQAQRYASLSVPLEILHGEADTIVPASVHAIPLAKAAPHAHLSLLAGVGHMPHHAVPERVVAAIDRLAGHG